MQEFNKNSKFITFEEIKHIDDFGVEFWYARELMKVLQYTKWQNFKKIIEKAKETCKNSGINVIEHFTDVSKLSKRANNAGYNGLYNGETADDIAKRKGLRYREEILDNMGSTELIANLFRISQTEEKLIRDNIKTEKEANKIHYNVGAKVRKTIKELGGTMPEDLPTPKKSLKQLEKENKRVLMKKEEEI